MVIDLCIRIVLVGLVQTERKRLHFLPFFLLTSESITEACIHYTKEQGSTVRRSFCPWDSFHTTFEEQEQDI